MHTDPVAEALEALAEKMEALSADVRDHQGAMPTGYVTVPAWAPKLFLALATAAVIGLFGLVLQVRSIADTFVTRERAEQQHRELERLIQPAPDVLRRLTDHERRLGRLEDGRQEPRP